MRSVRWSVACLVAAIGMMNLESAFAQQAQQGQGRPQPPRQAEAERRPARQPTRQPPPTRDPNTPGFVKAKELPDGEVAPIDVDGNFIIGPTRKKAPEMVERPDVPKGTVKEFVMKSEESKIYPGIAREPGTFGTNTRMTSRSVT